MVKNDVYSIAEKNIELIKRFIKKRKTIIIFFIDDKTF